MVLLTIFLTMFVLAFRAFLRIAFILLYVYSFLLIYLHWLCMYLLDHDKSPLPLKGKCSVRCWLHIVRWLNWLLFSMESSGVYKQAVPVLLPLAQIGLTGDWARPGPKMPFSCCSYKMSINVLYSVLIVDIRITVKLSYIYPILNTRSLLLSSMITK